MLLLSFLLLLCSTTTTTVRGTNILVTTGIPGSHLFSSYRLAHFLSSHGYNVTLLSASVDHRLKETDPRIRLIYLPGFSSVKEFFDADDGAREESMRVETDDSATWPLYGLEKARIALERKTRAITRAICNDEVNAIVREGGFGAIVAEATSMQQMQRAARIYNWTTPIMAFYLVPFMLAARSTSGYPMLLTSEPNSVFGTLYLQQSLSIRDRAMIIWDLARFGIFFSSVLDKAVNEVAPLPADASPAPKLVLNLFSEHPALSFPYLAPPNALYIADIFLSPDEDIPPMDAVFTEFLANCPQTALVSFGSVFKDFPALPYILEYLGKVPGLCVITKADPGIIESRDTLLVTDWLPQQALLQSGQISFFVSHCGSNSRLEAIAAGVPLLCVPGCWDQPNNAAMMVRRQFGLMLRKEHVGEEGRVEEVVGEMLERRDEFAANMIRAREIVLGEPARGSTQLLFLLDQVVRYGEVDYLENGLIKSQGIMEIYNLDVIGVVIAVVGFVVVVVVVGCCKLCRLLVGGKQKTE